VAARTEGGQRLLDGSRVSTGGVRVDTIGRTVPRQRRTPARRSGSVEFAPPERAPVRGPRSGIPRTYRVPLDLLVATVIAALLVPPLPALLTSTAWVSCLALLGGYPRTVVTAGSSARSVSFARLQVALALAVAVGAVASTRGAGDQFLLGLAAAACACATTRTLVGWLARRGLLTVVRTRRTVVVGDERDLRWVMGELRRSRRHGLEVCAACLVGSPTVPTIDGVATYHGVDGIAEVVDRHAADTVVLTNGHQMTSNGLRRLAWRLEASRAELLLTTGWLDLAVRRLTLSRVGQLPVLQVSPATTSGAARVVKDTVERVLATVGLVLLSPVLVLLMLAVRVESPGPALYRQQRIGRGGHPFAMYKLRTMVDDAELRRGALELVNEADGALFKVRADPRITRLGRVLRRYSLDELPQLWNVVRGDMALVGPRPALPGEVSRYDGDARRRLAVKPGITGLWQVSGRSNLSWEQAVRLDLRYVDNWSLGLDLVILCWTVRAVLRHEGAY